ncbi:MAG: diguanylate cyclase [Myxococcales bacterium]|nr:diguanylate cyclase [Myxococcales bacterium]
MARQQLVALTAELCTEIGATRAASITLQSSSGDAVVTDLAIESLMTPAGVPPPAIDDSTGRGGLRAGAHVEFVEGASRVPTRDARDARPKGPKNGDSAVSAVQSAPSEVAVVAIYANGDVRGGLLVGGFSARCDRERFVAELRARESALAQAFMSVQGDVSIGAADVTLDTPHPLVMYDQERHLALFANVAAQKSFGVLVGSRISPSLLPENLESLAPGSEGVEHSVVGEGDQPFHARTRPIAWLGQRFAVCHMRPGRIKRKTTQLRIQLHQRAVSFAESVDGLWEWNTETNRAYFSSHWARMLGFEHQAIDSEIGAWIRLVHPDDRGRLLGELGLVAKRARDSFSCEYRVAHRDGHYLWMHGRGLAQQDENGVRVVAGAQTDITERKAVEERLWVAAHHDALTNLPNRVLLLDRIGRCLVQQRRRSDSRFALIFLDVDRFKTINDTYGHSAGDQVLVSVARRLETCVRECDTVSRIGGDEFAVLLVDVERTSDVVIVADRISRVLAEPLDVAGQRLVVRASLGIAFSDGPARSADELLRDADVAMYEAKAGGGGRFAIFDAGVHESTTTPTSLEVALGHALEHKTLLLCYQPVLDRRHGRVIALEAQLTRSLGLEADAHRECLAVAEACKLAVDFGTQLLDRAFRNFAAWRERLPVLSGVQLIVNVASEQLDGTDLVQQLTRLSSETGMAPQNVCLDIRESSLMLDAPQAMRALPELRRFGVGLQIGEFGAGSSALMHLHRLPLDALQIHAGLTATLDDGGEPAVRAMIDLAHRLGFVVGADGVTNHDQVERLGRLSCDRLQGSYVGEPIEQGALEQLFRSPR